jgi:hypothetical protein
MKNKEKKKEGTENKPFIPKSPGSKTPEEVKDKNDPNPLSDPNYSYFPGVAYPTGARENEAGEDK